MSTGVRGYSDFFTSGFRAVTTRGQPLHYSQNGIPYLGASAAACDASPPRSKRTLAQFAQRRPRPSSMIIQGSTPTTREKPQGRRASFISSFSSLLFDRKLSAPGAQDALSTPSVGSRRSLQSYGSCDSLPEVWVTAGGPHTPSAPNGRNAFSNSPAVHHPADPFASSPDTGSVFIELSSDSSRAGTPKRESFLSLTGSSSCSSSLYIRHDRPTSTQSMPLPSRSRRSSFQHWPPPQEKSEFWSILEEEPELNSLSLVRDHEEWDSPAKIDWRQFHIELLTDD